MVNASALLTPVFIQVALTLALLFWGGYLRVQAVRSRVVQARDVSLRQPNWPPQTTKVMNAYHNQLELPLLFYLVVVLALTQLATIPGVLVILAWLFVLSRVAHVAIHVTTNDIVRRFFLFLASAIVLLLMWFIFMIRIYFGA